MSRAFLALNLLIIILPSTLYAKIHFEHVKVLNESNMKLHTAGFSNVRIFEIRFVNPSIFGEYATTPFVIYGIDKVTRNAYLDLWSIDDDLQSTLHWAIQNFNKEVIVNDEILTVTVPASHGSSSSGSGPAQDYRLTFFTKDEYNRFINTLLPPHLNYKA